MTRETGKILAAAAAFFLITSLTIAWSRFSGGLALIWPGTAILTALLVVVPATRWLFALAVFALCSTVATAFFGFGPKIAAPLALVNVFEGFLIAGMLRSLRPQRDWLTSVAGLERMLFSVFIGTCIAAVPGGIMAAWVVGGEILPQVIDWITGHTLGSLLCFPIAYFLVSGILRRKVAEGSPRYVAECAMHGTLIAVVSWLAFFESTLALLFLPVVPLMYASFRCGRIAALLGLIIIGVVGVASLQLELGNLSATEFALANDVQFLQFYLATCLLLSLPASVALKQHRLVLLELGEKRALEGLVADHADDALLNLDADGKVRYHSPSSRRLSGMSDLVGMSLVELFDPGDEALLREELALAADDPDATRTLERAVVRGDEVRWFETKLRAVPSADGQGVTGFAVTIRDMTARKRAELSAVRDAETDALTGLPNRRAFLRHIEPRLARAAGQSLSLAIFDLDHFKAVNDTHGHTAGDAALAQVAGVLRQLSGPNRYFARLGGEEFVLVAEQISLTAMIELCEEVRRRIAELDLESHDGVRFGTTASAGIARIGEPMTAAEALSAADLPLYAAKKAGRNRVEIALAAPLVHRQLRSNRAA
jgi:diguanylate cyclase (GGDEF)-like protein/PAS domain S-box-containing protein